MEASSLLFPRFQTQAKKIQLWGVHVRSLQLFTVLLMSPSHPLPFPNVPLLCFCLFFLTRNQSREAARALPASSMPCLLNCSYSIYSLPFCAVLGAIPFFTPSCLVRGGYFEGRCLGEGECPVSLCLLGVFLDQLEGH